MAEYLTGKPLSQAVFVTAGTGVGAIIFIAVGLAAVGFLLGRARDHWLARRIGEETSSRIVRPEAEHPVILLEKLNELRLSGALTEEEYEVQKTRILGQA